MPFVNVKMTTKSVAAGTTEEVLAGEPWSDSFHGAIGNVLKLGVYGDMTAGTYYELWLGGQLGPNGILHHTAYDEDHVEKFEVPIRFVGSVRMKIHNAAAGAQTYTVLMKIV